MKTTPSIATKVLITLAAALICLPGLIRAQEITNSQRMKWFNEARFGMFIHWGLYSVPAGEWNGKTDLGEWFMIETKMKSSEYEKFASQFNPVKFDAKAWVKVAKDAGMKYIVITSKHHDGFCLYDSKLTDYNIVKATPYGKDVMKDLSKACHEAGMILCFYYSLADWHHPELPAKHNQQGFHGAPNPNADCDKYIDYMKGQLRELLTNYGPIGIIWFDDGGAFPTADREKHLHSQEVIDLIHKLQPNCLVNNRIGGKVDYGTPEQYIPEGKPKDAFEVCMTLNSHWGYNKADQNWKEPKVIIQNLVDIAHKGGNYLLNVGPTAEGQIPADSIRILNEVGKWMKVNSESIYATTSSPLAKTPSWGRVTAKNGKVYLHVFNWPIDGKLAVEGLKTKPLKVYFLADQKRPPLNLSKSEETLTLTLPEKAPDAIDTVIVLELDSLN